MGSVTDYPLTIRHKDGHLVDVLYNASVYRDAKGNVLGVFAAARDVTESKRILSEFAETKNFLDNILESSTKYSIIGKDLNHRILSWNEGARRNYGYTAEEIIGQDASILHTPEDIESGLVDQLLAEALREGTGRRRVRARAEGRFAVHRERRRHPPQRRLRTAHRLPADEQRHLGEEAGRGATARAPRSTPEA